MDAWVMIFTVEVTRVLCVGLDNLTLRVFLMLPIGFGLAEGGPPSHERFSNVIFGDLPSGIGQEEDLVYM